MTIAVSVVVKPSRLLKTLLMALCAGMTCIGAGISYGLVGELPWFARLACSLLAFVPSIVGAIHIIRCQYPYRLDIGGTGQIRLTRLFTAPDCVDNSNNHPHSPGMLVTLLPDSTLWSRFMMLRLQDESGQVHALSIWPDSVLPTSFRALAVACRWIAAHHFAE